jgi:hypothetical protein
VCQSVQQGCSSVRNAAHSENFPRCTRNDCYQNSRGFRECRAKALGEIHTDEDLGRAYETFTKHVYFKHVTGDDGPVKETVFERLWVLQEVSLSNALQFIRCDEVSPEFKAVRPAPDTIEDSTNDVFTLFTKFAERWGWYDDNTTKDNLENLTFLNNFIHCGSISRSPPLKSSPVPSRGELFNHINSMRMTTHSRDFILAIMPQYEFYKVPEIAKDMSFGQLFVDCFQQGRKAGWDLHPLVSLPGVRSECCHEFSVTDNVPEPIYLGDMTRLFLGPISKVDDKTVRDIQHVKVQRVIDTNDAAGAIQLVLHCLQYSSALFAIARIIPLRNRSRERDEFESSEPCVSDSLLSRPQAGDIREKVEVAADILDRMQGIGDYQLMANQIEELLLQNPSSTEALIRLAAVISCGLGVSAYEWARENMTPISVEFRGRPMLSMISKIVAADDDYEFLLVKVGQWSDLDRFALVACNKKADPIMYNSGLFPWEAVVRM